MKWRNLMRKLCPACGYELVITQVNATEKHYVCPDLYYDQGSCDFSIGSDQYDKVINGIQLEEMTHDEQDNLQGLNNL